VRRADVMELLGHDVLREFGLVAFAAQVGEVKIFQFRRHDLRGGLGGGDVREMAVASEDALLERPRAARAILQHLHVVVGFEDEDVRGADAIQHEPGRVAEVGGETEVAGGRADQKSDRILCVVRDGKGFDEHVGDLKARAGGEQLPVDFGFERVGRFEREVGFLAPFVFECPDGCVLSLAIAIDGDLKFIGESEQSCDVVGMFVGDQNGGEIFRCFANAGETHSDLARGKSGVNQDAAIFSFDVGAIAGRAAAEDGEFDGHRLKLVLW